MIILTIFYFVVNIAFRNILLKLTWSGILLSKIGLFWFFIEFFVFDNQNLHKAWIIFGLNEKLFNIYNWGFYFKLVAPNSIFLTYSYIIFNSRVFTCTSTINNFGLLWEWHCAISSPCLFFHIHNFKYIIKLYKNNLQSMQSICVHLIYKQSKSCFNPNRILLFIYFYFKWKMRTCERKGFI